MSGVPPFKPGLLDKLPNDLKNSPEAQLLRPAVDRKVYNIVHLIYRAKNYEGPAFRRKSFNDKRCTLRTQSSCPG